MCGTLQTNEEHRGRQFQYSTLRFSAHCWFFLGTKSGKWPGNSLQAPTQSLLWFPTEELGHWNLCQVQGFPLSQPPPSARRDHWVYTKYIHYNSSSLYRLQAIAVKSQDKRSQKAVYAFTRKNTKKSACLVPGCLFSWERLLVKCADFKSEWRPGSPESSGYSLFSTSLVAFISMTCPGCSTLLWIHGKVWSTANKWW